MLVDGYVRVSQVRGRSRPQFISPSEPAGPIREWAALHGHTVANVWEQLDESGASADPAIRSACSPPAPPVTGPRQSVVYFARDGERLMISPLTDRLKAQDVRRTGWASLCVMGHRPPYPSATFSGRRKSPRRISAGRRPGSRSASAVQPSHPSR